MFGISFGELTIILIIALIVIGPERLPTVARTVGRWVGKLRGYTDTFRSDIEREFQLNDLKEDLNKFKQSTEVQELRKALSEVSTKGEQYLRDTKSQLESTLPLEHKTTSQDSLHLDHHDEDMALEDHFDQHFEGHFEEHLDEHLDPDVMTAPPEGFNPDYGSTASSRSIQSKRVNAYSDEEWELNELVKARQLEIAMEDAPYPMYLTYYLNRVRQERGQLSIQQRETLYLHRLKELNQPTSH